MSDDDPKPPDPPKAPAVHTSELWGGPRLVENATAEPVQVDTKQEYWDLLNRVGARMKDQQESTTGPAREAPPPIAPLPEIEVRAMAMDEAHVLGAFEAVLRRYRLVASLWCEHCFARGRHHGVRYIVTDREISIACRCGVARYTPHPGTTDAVLRTLNLAVTENDKSMGVLVTAAGPVPAPTIDLHQMEDLLIRRWLVAMRRRGKEPRIFHLGACHPSRSPRAENEALAIHMSPEQLILVCQCPRQLFYQRAEVVAPTPTPTPTLH